MSEFSSGYSPPLYDITLGNRRRPPPAVSPQEMIPEELIAIDSAYQTLRFRIGDWNNSALSLRFATVIIMAAKLSLKPGMRVFPSSIS